MKAVLIFPNILPYPNAPSMNSNKQHTDMVNRIRSDTTLCWYHISDMALKLNSSYQVFWQVCTKIRIRYTILTVIVNQSISKQPTIKDSIKWKCYLDSQLYHDSYKNENMINVKNINVWTNNTAFSYTIWITRVLILFLSSLMLNLRFGKNEKLCTSISINDHKI